MNKRLPNLAPPFAKTRNWLTRFFSRPVKNLSPKQTFRLGFALLTLATVFLIQNPFWHTSGEIYKEGDIGHESIISPADISVTDTEETEKLRQAARESVRPIFTFEANRGEQAAQSFRLSWEELKKKNETGNANIKSNSIVAKSNSNVKTEPQWTGAGGAEVGKIFAGRTFSANELDAIARVLRESADGSIYNDSDRQYFQNEITLIDRLRPNQQSIVSLPESSMTALSAARGKLKPRLEDIKSLSPKEVTAFNTALEPLIQPNIIFDSAATKNAVDAAASGIPPITISLKRGQMVAREGDTITPDVLAEISAIRNYSESTRQWNRFFGLLLIIAALYWIAWKFIEHRSTILRLSLSPQMNFALFGFVVFIQTLLVAICFRLAEFTAAQNVRAPLNDPMLWSLAIPFAFTSLLLTLLADRRIALFSGIFASILAGLIVPNGIVFILYSAISSAVAVYGIGNYRSRQSVTTAGCLVGAANALTAIALIGYTQQPFILNTVLLAVGCGLVGGLITSAVTAVFLPVCESMFGILTDVKLLELSNADLPVLGQLALRAPGTNQHSHAVGQLAEEASRAVGANPLLTRIGALYHDIGKLGAPEHYIENQLGKNPHDRLKPTQSAKIIISHINYGIKLGKEIGLPQRIIDFIPQHHGTRSLHYFLRKAQAETADNGGEIEEADFRYPGPKPQFKEAAIMMIADSCEAAARSLAQPTPENIRFIITKIIDAIISDDQLDECDLTLRELSVIRESMIKSLVAIYHSRIDYPGYVPPSSMDKIIVPNDDGEERGMKYANPSDIPISLGGEIEDEAIDHSNQPDKAEAKTVK
ncbi:MAG: HD family phosphohydrolase [Pyrinomonadaceae bacterium]